MWKLCWGYREAGGVFIRRITIRRKCGDRGYQEVGDFNIRRNRARLGYIHSPADCGCWELCVAMGI